MDTSHLHKFFVRKLQDLIQLPSRDLDGLRFLSFRVEETESRVLSFDIIERDVGIRFDVFVNKRLDIFEAPQLSFAHLQHSRSVRHRFAR